MAQDHGGVKLEGVRISARGQVTIPREIREQFGLEPETEVEFHVVGGSITLKKTRKTVDFAKWRGYCADSFKDLGLTSVDEFIEEIRGR